MTPQDTVFLFWINFKFLRFVFQSSSYSCAGICKIMTYVSPIRSSSKEKFAQYIRRTYNRWWSHSSLLSVLSKLVYAIVVSVPAEKHNIHMHTSIFIPQVAHTHLTLRGQCCIRLKDVFTSCGSGHKTLSGLYSPWVHGHDSSHDGLQSLSHDRDYPQAIPSWVDGSGIHITWWKETYCNVPPLSKGSQS
jgi:hypothetical protein